ncbi:MAG: MAE_28990/MAE_18760 family HEPN-like nuclease [Planctomycetota bacterium]
MESAVDRFHKKRKEINCILEIAKSLPEHSRRILHQSYVVHIVAAWEAFIEEEINNATFVVISRAKNSNALPEKIRNRIVNWKIFSGSNELSNKKETIDTIWKMVDDGWKSYYLEYAKEKLHTFQTASSDNILKLVDDLFACGKDFSFSVTKDDSCSKKYADEVNGFIKLRHSIAHGEDVEDFDIRYINNTVNMLSSIVDNFTLFVEKQINRLSTQGKTYSLKQKFIIDWLENFSRLAIKGIKTFRVDVTDSIDKTMYANHKKLEFWGLVEGKPSARKITERCVEFINNRIKLPLEVIDFYNKNKRDVTPNPGTEYVNYSELKKLFASGMRIKRKER